MNDNPPKRGISPEKAEQLRQLLPVLEDRIKHFQANADFDGLSAEVRKIRTAIEDGRKESALSQVVKSFRNIAEGIVGGVILELIPEDVKSWVRKEIVGSSAASDGKRPRDRRMYVVKVEIVGGSLKAFDAAVESRQPFVFTLSESYMRIWCGAELAATLRLTLDKSWIEHPTKEEQEEIRQKPLRVLTPPEAQALRVELARLILCGAAKGIAQHGGSTEIPSSRHRPAVGADHSPRRSRPGSSPEGRRRGP